MKAYYITQKEIDDFRCYLREEEKSDNTVEKYLRDVKMFVKYYSGKISKETVIAYKHDLISNNYAIRSINSMLSSLNCLFSFLGWDDLKVKTLKLQRQIFCSEEKELTRKDYEKLCRTAEQKHNKRLNLIMQTICSTGIRVSELQFVTLEAIRKGKLIVSMKGKTRTVIIPKDLKRKLCDYAAENNIFCGMIFVTKNGKRINRTNIWREMKNLCVEAHINPEKVFPHNLRHLFARVFYSIDKDIAKLADVLGHSNINTTRIYIVSTGSEHRLRIEQMRLII